MNSLNDHHQQQPTTLNNLDSDQFHPHSTITTDKNTSDAGDDDLIQKLDALIVELTDSLTVVITVMLLTVNTCIMVEGVSFHFSKHNYP